MGCVLPAFGAACSCWQVLVCCETTLHPAAPLLQDLLLSYNIGISVEQREKDMNARAANLVGLQVPKLE